MLACIPNTSKFIIAVRSLHLIVAIVASCIPAQGCAPVVRWCAWCAAAPGCAAESTPFEFEICHGFLYGETMRPSGKRFIKSFPGWCCHCHSDIHVRPLQFNNLGVGRYIRHIVWFGCHRMCKYLVFFDLVHRSVVVYNSEFVIAWYGRVCVTCVYPCTNAKGPSLCKCDSIKSSYVIRMHNQSSGNGSESEAWLLLWILFPNIVARGCTCYLAIARAWSKWNTVYQSQQGIIFTYVAFVSFDGPFQSRPLWHDMRCMICGNRNVLLFTKVAPVIWFLRMHLDGYIEQMSMPAFAISMQVQEYQFRTDLAFEHRFRISTGTGKKP